jgi:hypothetical protein
MMLCFAPTTTASLPFITITLSLPTSPHHFRHTTPPVHQELSDKALLVELIATFVSSQTTVRIT